MKSRGVRRRLPAAVFMAHLFCACSTPLGELTVLAPEPLPREFVTIETRVRGEDCVLQLLGFALLSPSVSDAVADALAAVPGADAIVSASIGTRFRFYGLASEICVTVEGEAVATR